MGEPQDRRALLAIALSLAVYFAWMALFAPKGPPPGAEGVGGGEAVPAEAAATRAEPPAAEPARDAADAAEAPAEAVPDHAEALDRPEWRGRVHSRNGAVGAVSLAEYTRAPEVVPLWTWAVARITARDGEAGPWRPYSGGEDALSVLTEEGALVLAGAGEFDDDGAGRPGDPSAYRVERGPDGAVVARRARPDGLVVTKTYRPGDVPYTLRVEVRFENRGAAPLGRPWVGVADRMEGASGRFANSVRPEACVDESVEHVYKVDELAGDGLERFEGPVSWLGVGDRFFMAVVAPEGEFAPAEVVVDELPGGRVGVFAPDARPLGPGESRTISLVAYLGPKRTDALKAAGHDLDRAVEFGIFGLFSKPLLQLLKLFHRLVGSWGGAIVLLTILVKLVFFPLTQKAFVSSRKMQAIQPRLAEIRERYKDNRELQTQETMRVMQEAGVNPMGGCLPTLIQLPVWFALYRVMLNSVELYDSSFLYLRDLTAADPFGVLPLLYIGLMLLQQRMMPMTGMDPAQQRIFKLMPLFFGFIMFGFPSGLVLYFCVNMVLTIVQQWFIRRRYPDPAAAAEA